jgi:cyclic beta-1,2-glucan synthetase
VLLRAGEHVRQQLQRLVQALSSQHARGHLLDADPDVEDPVRSELYSVSQLEQHARALAERHQVLARARSPRGIDRLLPRLATNELALHHAYSVVTEAQAGGARITPAAEWLIDNFHLIDEQIRTARRHLPRGYNRELPRLSLASGGMQPRVYDLAIELVSHSHGRVDIQGLRAFVTAYQEARPLTLGELWAIPIMLRLAVIDTLRSVAARIVAGRYDRARAARWVERMLEVAGSDPSKVLLILAELVVANPKLTNAFVAELASRLQGQGPAMLFPVAWLEQRLAERGHSVEHVFALVTQNQAADQVSIGNCIASVRFLGATDWRAFVESMSGVEAALCTDPAGAYAAMTFDTRDRYRHAVEELARRAGRSEQEVAEAALALSAAPIDPTGAPRPRPAGGAVGVPTPRARLEPIATPTEVSQRRRHVGTFLIGEGRAELERALHLPSGLGVWSQRWARGHPLLIYGAAISLLTAAIAAAVIRRSAAGSLLTWELALAAPALLVVCSQLGVAVTQWMATVLVPPRALPRLDFVAGIPAAHRTLVAVPILLTELAEIDRQCDALEVRFLANRDPHLGLCLVTDFRDAASATTDGDAALLDRAVDRITALNAKYGSGAGASFFLLHRARRWNPRERVWMGWERKRGKLEELNAALRGDREIFSTVVGELSELQDVKYVIVLDADTDLPRDAARQLAGTLAHPLNRPCYDAARGRVTRGYSILQPRVSSTMASVRRSRFSRLFAGVPGIDPYTLAVSDVYQDLFAEGSFVGKGIYDVDAVRRALHDRLPENRVLSHDLLEGGYARAGLVSDVTLFEDFPAAHGADVSRRVRWMRGDWQIMAWLGRRVPTAQARRAPNPLSWLSQWKLLDNLRRSLVPPALLVLLAVGWWSGRGGAATIVALSVLLLPGVLASASELSAYVAELPLRQHLHEVGRGFGLMLMRQGFALATLPYDAGLAVAAIGRSAWRVGITRRHLLEWRTAADAARSDGARLGSAFSEMGFAVVAAVGAALVLARFRPQALLFAGPLLVLWALSPLLSAWISRPIEAPSNRLLPDDLEFLHLAARRTWRFFEAFVTAEDHALPPDNFQDDPPQGLAHRTSPTNIGLSLTANLAAYDFGYLSAAGLLARSAQTMATMDALERHRGHFYNWYDTRTLEPLLPRYVSTVDSGNLVGHLVILAAGLEELAGHPIIRGGALRGLADTLGVLAAQLPTPSGELASVLARLRATLMSAPATLTGMNEALRVAGEEVTHLEQLSSLRAGAGEVDAELRWWLRALATQREGAVSELHHLAPWIELAPPSLAELAGPAEP